MLAFALATPLITNRAEKYWSELSKVEAMSACVVRIKNYPCENNAYRSPSPRLPRKSVHVAEVVFKAIVEFEVLLVVDQVV